MKNKVMKILVLSLMICLTITSIVLADSMNMDNGTEKKVDGINAELSFKNEKAQTGSGDIMITLLDSNKQPILDAIVSATAAMDISMNMDMKGIKPIAIKFETGDSQGRYMGSVNFTNEGRWIVKAKIKVQGQEKNVDFDVDVVGSGPNWGIIGGFLGAMALIIIVALVIKKKSVKA